MKPHILCILFLILFSAAELRAVDGIEDRIRTASKGQRVELEKLLVPGKRTVVAFYADWCPACRVATPRLEKIVRADAMLALQKIDIKDWNSPVARQYGVRSLPHVQVYSVDGKLEGEGGGEVIKALAHGEDVASAGRSILGYFPYAFLALGAGLYIYGKSRQKMA